MARRAKGQKARSESWASGMPRWLRRGVGKAGVTTSFGIISQGICDKVLRIDVNREHAGERRSTCATRSSP